MSVATDVGTTGVDVPAIFSGWLDRFATATQAADVRAVATLVTEDAWGATCSP